MPTNRDHLRRQVTAALRRDGGHLRTAQLVGKVLARESERLSDEHTLRAYLFGDQPQMWSCAAAMYDEGFRYRLRPSVDSERAIRRAFYAHPFSRIVAAPLAPPRSAPVAATRASSPTPSVVTPADSLRYQEYLSSKAQTRA